jgi:hypothetical protein
LSSYKERLLLYARACPCEKLCQITSSFVPILGEACDNARAPEFPQSCIGLSLRAGKFSNRKKTILALPEFQALPCPHIPAAVKTTHRYLAEPGTAYLDGIAESFTLHGFSVT